MANKQRSRAWQDAERLLSHWFTHEPPPPPYSIPPCFNPSQPWTDLFDTQYWKCIVFFINQIKQSCSCTFVYIPQLQTPIRRLLPLFKSLSDVSSLLSSPLISHVCHSVARCCHSLSVKQRGGDSGERSYFASDCEKHLFLTACQWGHSFTPGNTTQHLDQTKVLKTWRNASAS